MTYLRVTHAYGLDSSKHSPHIIKRKLYSQSVSQSTNKLHLSVVGENLALLLAGATTTVDITDLKKVILHN